MDANCENARAGAGDQGIDDPLRAESPPCSPRYDEDRREHLKTVELVVQRHSQERKPECPGSRPLGTQAGARTRQVALRNCWRGEGPAAAGEVRRRPVASGQAGLDTAARRSRADRPAVSGGRWRCLDMEIASRVRVDTGV